MNQLIQKILAGLFNHLVKQQFLAGHRSYIAGFSSILGAVVIVLDMVVNGNYSEERVGAAFAAFVFGQKIIGDAGKRDKLIAAQAATPTMANIEAAAKLGPAAGRPTGVGVN